MTNDPNRTNITVESKSSGGTIIGIVLLVVVLFLIWYFFGGQIAEWFNSLGGNTTPTPPAQ